MRHFTQNLVQNSITVYQILADFSEIARDNRVLQSPRIYQLKCLKIRQDLS